jgi:hypothetical protein
MSPAEPILDTGAAGRVGAVGGAVVESLLRRDLPVRALVRRDDERADALRAAGAEVVVGDLTRTGDVLRALAGCRGVYFGMSVSAPYLEATVATAAAARAWAASGGASPDGPWGQAVETATSVTTPTEVKAARIPSASFWLVPSYQPVPTPGSYAFHVL